jgi:hypothetical protein
MTPQTNQTGDINKDVSNLDEKNNLDGSLDKNLDETMTIEEIVIEFQEKLPCIQTGCIGDGVIPNRVSEDEWEPEQCQYCYQVRFPLIAWLTQAFKDYGDAVHKKSYMDGYNEAIKIDTAVDSKLKEVEGKLQSLKKKCPLCDGKGTVPKRQNTYTKDQRERARKLYAQGVSLRVIGQEIGVNHPQKIKSLIMAKTL